jgi:NAD dependent epimerase/dehydratase
MSERVLVTGAGGFIGSHLVERLVARGDRVRAFVHYNGAGRTGLLELLAPEMQREIEIVAGDIIDPWRVESAVRGCEVVYHLAALIAIPYSYDAPWSYTSTNVTGTLNVAQACLRAGVRRLVHTSTSEVYGSAQYVPIDEAHPLVGQSPYSASKIGADKVVESFGLSFGLPACTVRPFNTYGPRQSARAVIPTIISQALRGDVVRLGSTTPVRDLTFATDTADGFVAAAGAPGAVGETINLGVGHGVSIAQIVEEVGRRLGKTLVVETDEQRVRPQQSEVTRLISDNAKAARVLGWAPTVPFAEGLDATIRFIDANLSRFSASGYVI